jgi:hypothetical protein
MVETETNQLQQKEIVQNVHPVIEFVSSLLLRKTFKVFLKAIALLCIKNERL